MWEKGLIYQGYKVVPYDPRITTLRCPLTKLHSASTRKSKTHPCSSGSAARMPKTPPIWFGRQHLGPYPSNLALAVGADIDYVAVSRDDEVLILAEALLDHALGEGPHNVVERFKGSDLVGRRYARIFDYLDVSPSEKLAGRCSRPTLSVPKTEQASSIAPQRTVSTTSTYVKLTECPSCTGSAWMVTSRKK